MTLSGDESNISKCEDKLLRHSLYEGNSHMRISRRRSVPKAWA